MTDLRDALQAMTGETVWQEAKIEIAEIAEQRAEEARRQEEEAAERRRVELIEQAPSILQEVFTAMRSVTPESVTQAQQLLGGQFSQEPTEVSRREVLSDALYNLLPENRKKRTDGNEVYSKLHQFLHAASNGFESAQQLTDAFVRRDAAAMLTAMHVPEDGSSQTSRQRVAHGSCAAVMGLTLMDGDWTPALWTEGFYRLEDLTERARELLQLSKEAGLDNSVEDGTTEETATLQFSRAS